MAQSWWKEPDMGAVMPSPVPSGEPQGCSAMRMWRSATATLVAPDVDDAWQQILDASPPDSLWHSLRNCVAYQAGIWQNLLNKGIDDVIQPAAFKLAVVLRHTPTELTVRLLSELLRQHPQSQDLTSYILALLTDDEALWSGGGCSSVESSAPPSPASPEQRAAASPEQRAAASPSAGDQSDPAVESGNEVQAAPVQHEVAEQSAAATDEDTQPGDGAAAAEPDSAPRGAGAPRGPPTPAGPAPLRDLQLFGDCELAVLAASREEYDAHASLVRAEYSKLTNDNYVELRIKVLNQFSQIPKLYHTPEFECFEAAARENIEREISTLREHLLAGRAEQAAAACGV